MNDKENKPAEEMVPGYVVPIYLPVQFRLLHILFALIKTNVFKKFVKIGFKIKS